MTDPGLTMVALGLAMSIATGTYVTTPEKAPAISYPHDMNRAVLVKVRRVVDGDTIIVCVGDDTCARVRLAAIDAPEKKQAGGALATAAMVALAEERVYLVPRGRDRFGRVIGDVVTTEGIWVNAAVVCAGFAWAAPAQYNPHQTIVRCQRVAERRRTGLWALGLMKMPPWRWRRGTVVNRNGKGDLCSRK